MSDQSQLEGKVFVTGAAGFIGSNLVDRLLSLGLEVVGCDNFSTGKRRFLEGALKNPHFRLIEGDCLNLPTLTSAMKSCDWVCHLSANADVRFGLNHPNRDLEQNTIVTFNVLEAMRANEIKKIVFSSTGSVYGEATVIPTPEVAPFPVQTSLYGASKLAGEGLIQSYCEGFGFEGYIFRFVSILGERYTHGHIVDFYKQLLDNPGRLKILGDGSQKKSYLYIGDCLNALMRVMTLRPARNEKQKVKIYNLGTSEFCEVINSVGWICSSLQLKPQLEFTGGSRGWVGDNPFIFLDTAKVQSELKWKPELTIQQGVERTINWLRDHQWIFEAKA